MRSIIVKCLVFTVAILATDLPAQAFDSDYDSDDLRFVHRFVPSEDFHLGMTKFEVESLIAKNFKEWKRDAVRIPLDPAQPLDKVPDDQAQSFEGAVFLDRSYAAGGYDNSESYSLYFTSPATGGKLYALRRSTQFKGDLIPNIRKWKRTILKYWGEPEVLGKETRNIRLMRYHFDASGSLGWNATEQCERVVVAYSKMKENNVRELRRLSERLAADQCQGYAEAEAKPVDEDRLNRSSVMYLRVDYQIEDLIHRAGGGVSSRSTDFDNDAFGVVQ